MCRYNLDINYLVENFESGLNEFYSNSEASFSKFHRGPCPYFHRQTIERLRHFQNQPNFSYSSVCGAIRYVELLYATLTAWGMNSIGAELEDFSTFQEAIGNTNFIEYLNDLHNSNLIGLGNPQDIEGQVRELYDHLASGVRIMGTEKSLVGVSKTLHHLLPDLLMPVDGRFILRILNRLRDRNLRPSSQGDSFRNYWKCIMVSHQLANNQIVTSIYERSNRPMDTSITKVIDNALIGMTVLMEG